MILGVNIEVMLAGGYALFLVGVALAFGFAGAGAAAST